MTTVLQDRDVGAVNINSCFLLQGNKDHWGRLKAINRYFTSEAGRGGTEHMSKWNSCLHKNY